MVKTPSVTCAPSSCLLPLGSQSCLTQAFPWLRSLLDWTFPGRRLPYLVGCLTFLFSFLDNMLQKSQCFNWSMALRRFIHDGKELDKKHCGDEVLASILPLKRLKILSMVTLSLWVSFSFCNVKVLVHVSMTPGHFFSLVQVKSYMEAQICTALSSESRENDCHQSCTWQSHFLVDSGLTWHSKYDLWPTQQAEISEVLIKKQNSGTLLRSTKSACVELALWNPLNTPVSSKEYKIEHVEKHQTRYFWSLFLSPILVTNI